MKNLKAWLASLTVIGVVVAYAFGFAQLPKKVEAMEAASEATEDKVQELAHTVDKYIAVQTAKEEVDEEQKKLLLRVIEKLSQK